MMIFFKYLIMSINTIFSFEPVTNQHLKDIVSSFKNTSAGFDGLPIKVIKHNIYIYYVNALLMFAI